MKAFGIEEIQRLSESMRVSRQRLSIFRQTRFDIIKEYVGKHYSEDGAEDRVPINLLDLAIGIYKRNLVARTPRVSITTKHKQLKSWSYSLELAMDHLLDEIDFGSTLDDLVMDGLFSMGIIKVGISIHGQVEIGGFLHDVGQPYADGVDLDDWVHDVNAKVYQNVQFAGNKYFLPYEYLMDSKMYSNKENLGPSERQAVDQEGGDKVTNISRGNMSDKNEFIPQIEVWDIWLPQSGGEHGLLATFPVDSVQKPLMIREWEGPEHGPYQFLRYGKVPGQIMSAAPALQWLDIHELANRLFRKLGRQADRQKTNLLYQGSAADDARRVVEAGDGKVIRVDNVDALKEVAFGGADPGNLAFLLQAMDKFSWMAGNLDALGGLGPMAETLGQERMVTATASKRVQDMQDITVKFVRNVVRDLAFYLVGDPLIELPLVKRVPGTDIEIPIMFRTEDMEGDLVDYNLDIQPYSLQYDPPSQRLQTISVIFQQFIAPMLPLMEAQGIQVNMEGLLRAVAKYANMPELEEIVIFSGRQENSQPGPVTRFPSIPTTRHSVRTSVSGTVRPDRDAKASEALMEMANNNEQRRMAG